MTFCTIDGITLTVDSSTPKLAVEEVGQRGRAFDGTAQVGVRVVKRGWDLLLNPLNEADAIALMHLLLGKGRLLPVHEQRTVEQRLPACHVQQPAIQPRADHL